MSEDDPILVCCPYCLGMLGTLAEPDAPFVVPAACAKCGMDPRNDAPLETTLSRWGAMAKQACAACGAQVPALAIRCSKCKASLRVEAPKKRKAASPERAVAARGDQATTRKKSPKAKKG